MALSDIQYQTTHTLGIDKARELARQWIDDAAQKLGLLCQHQPGDVQDTVTFERMGVKGVMLVSGDSFALDIKLNMMMAAFKPMIEAEVAKNLAKAIEKASGDGAKGGVA